MKFDAYDCLNDGSWYCSGREMEIIEDNIWTLIEVGLQRDLSKIAIKCNDREMNCEDLVLYLRESFWKFTSKRVGVYIKRSMASVVATLGIWRNRSIYVPLAKEHPLSKLILLINNCSLDLIISDIALSLTDFKIISFDASLDVPLYLYERQ